MIWDPTHKPRLRLMEAAKIEDEDSGKVQVFDPLGLSPAVMTTYEPTLHLMALMDGQNTCQEIRTRFQAISGHLIAVDTLQSLLDQLASAHFLEGPAFEEHYASLIEEYRRQPTRRMQQADALGIDSSGEVFRTMLADACRAASPGRAVGLIAPHLDYPRGQSCYGLAYASLQDRKPPDRVVILGTNHHGRSASVVATGQSFSTPLGTTRCDTRFLEELESRCGPLRECELDHLREHSVDLQVAWLQYSFGVDSFEMVPFLCPDPCGPTGTTPYDGKGVDLRDFARALGELIAADESDTLVVAGADLSHVGLEFGDERRVDDAFLEEVWRHDRQALDAVEANDPDQWLRCISEKENPTRICSVGSIFALMAALPDAKATVLGYHQAVTPESQSCVTCAAVAFT